MAEREVKVRVSTEADTSGLEDIENALNNLEDKTITIRPEIESMELEEVENRIEELEDKRADIYLGVDDTPLEEVESELEELEARQIELTVNVDSSGVDEVSGKMDELESKSSETSDSLSAMGGAIAGLGAAAGLDQMITTADNINNSWNRLGLTFGTVSDEMKNHISSAAEATGRAGGTVRGFFNDMGIAGVTNTQLLSQSFEALSGRAYQTGSSIESMEQKMKMMVMSGNAGARQLTALGISTEALGRAMGVSADEATKMFKNLSQEERLRVLTQAMGDGKDANEKYKNSLAGMKEQANAAFAGLMGAIGQAILPVIIPAMKALTVIINAVSNAFKELPAPLKAIVGGFGALVLGATALLGTLSTVGFALKGVYDGFVIAKKGIDLLKDLSAVKNLVTGLKGIASTIQTTVIPAIMQMNSSTLLMGGGIIALVAILAVLIGYMVHLYNTNEQCRASVNKLGDDLTRVASGDYSGLKDVGSDLMAASDSFAQASGFAALIGEENYNRWVELRNGMLQAVTDMLGGAGEQLMLFGGQVNGVFQQAIISVQGFVNWLVQGFMQGIMSVQSFGMSLSQLPNYIMQAVTQGIANFQTLISQTNSILGSVIGAVASFGGNLIGQLSSSASSAVSAFGSGLSGMVAEAWAEFNDVLSAIYDFGAQAVAAAQNIGAQITQALFNRHSPGILAQETFLEMRDSKMFLEEGLSDMVDITRVGSGNILNNFNPDLNNNIGNVGNGAAASGGVVNNFSFTFTDFIDSKEKLTDLIIKTITDEIQWSNETANRTV